MFGAVEAGGTKFVCGIGTGPEDLTVAHVSTTSPDATLAAVTDFFRQEKRLDAVGIGSFGPIDINPGSTQFGHITSTPKSGWRDYNIVGAIRDVLRVPVGFDTDVNAAALGESHWGAGRGVTDFIYLTVGTGIGGGAMVNGQMVHGLAHPEMGHLPIRHDRTRDPFPGCCPYHGDCLEGLASGPAMQARWGMPAESLPADHPGWNLEAHYLAQGLTHLVYVLSPQRILLGGGVMRQVCLFDLIRTEMKQALGEYVQPGDVLPAQLGSRAGVLGALVLAQQAYQSPAAK